MAVHVPLSVEAIKEAKERMMPDSNVLLMADASPVVNADKDIIVGVYYLSKMDEGEAKVFSSVDEAKREYDLGLISHSAKIKIMIEDKFIETSIVRVILIS